MAAPVISHPIERPSVPGSSSERPSSYIPAFDFQPDPNWPGGYVSNVAKEDQHEVRKISVPGA